MSGEIKKLWYASYGSNLLEERFLYYINGGRPKGSLRTYRGCKNKTLPEASEKIKIKAELYFARKSKTWNSGGAAFIRPDEGFHVYGRMYLIALDQFIELVKQEIRFSGELEIDLKSAIKEGSLIIDEKSWYGRILFLDRHDDLPIFTFTNAGYLDSEINPPDRHYLFIIIQGLRETYEMTDPEILEYLSPKKGIKGTSAENLLKELLKEST